MHAMIYHMLVYGWTRPVIDMIFSCQSPLGAGQAMGPRPSSLPTPRAMPPYKYATSVRNTNPQVVQPIALQQVAHIHKPLCHRNTASFQI